MEIYLQDLRDMQGKSSEFFGEEYKYLTIMLESLRIVILFEDLRYSNNILIIILRLNAKFQDLLLLGLNDLSTKVGQYPAPNSLEDPT